MTDASANTVGNAGACGTSADARVTIAAVPAILGTVETNATDAAGAPAYASGAQKWNGAADIFANNPMKTKTAENTPSRPAGGAAAIVSNDVEPGSRRGTTARRA